MSIFRKLNFLAVLALLTGCGYHAGVGSCLSQYETVSIPYVIGDEDGALTSALVLEMTRSGALQYCHCGGDLILQVRLLDFNDENIGFRYYRKKHGKLTKSIIPSETRLTVEAEVTLCDTSSGCIVLGPKRVIASVEFDHDYYSSHNAVNIFSLGQLSDIDEAEDAAHHPLNEALARVIVNYVKDSW